MEGSKTVESLSRLALELGVCVLLAGVFAFLGVYDSDAMPWGFRFLFWFVLMVAGAVALSLAEPFVMRRWLPGGPLALHIALTSALVAVPLTIGLVGLNTDLSWQYSISNWVLQFLSVLIIAIVVVTGRAVVRTLLTKPTTPGSIPDIPDPSQSFRERLPLKFREAQLWAVSSEGHYLRVHTDKGDTLILMRLSDAVKELDAVEGLQTHRSWWVAKAGVDAVVTAQGKTQINLKNEIKAPVSRSRVKRVRAMDWA